MRQEQNMQPHPIGEGMVSRSSDSSSRSVPITEPVAKLQSATPHIPGFVHNPQALFKELRENPNWDHRSMRARSTLGFGIPYNYSNVIYEYRPMPPALENLAKRIKDELGPRSFSPNSCLINLYLDGNSSMGPHSDSLKGLADGTGIIIVSLGALRPLIFEHKIQKDSRHQFDLASGSLFYMSREVQNDWRHSIPRVAAASERMSLSFRQILQ